jgi:hypothetical protein
LPFEAGTCALAMLGRGAFVPGGAFTGADAPARHRLHVHRRNVYLTSNVLSASQQVLPCMGPAAHRQPLGCAGLV